jgi:hypothetical protein
MRLHRSFADSGNTLLVCSFTLAAVGLVLVAYLKLGSTNQILAARSQTWNIALPVAEAGVEEALTHINWNRGANLGSLGWTASGGQYSRTRQLDASSYYTVQIQPVGTQFRITATGYQRWPLGTNYLSRTVEATAMRTNQVFLKALIAKKHINCGKGTLIDSFDSTNPKYSTLGKYDPAKRKDNAGVAATSSKKNAVKVDKTKIYGEASTAPKGKVECKNGGTVGDTAWINSGKTGIQPERFHDDFTYDFPVVQAPWTSGGTPPSGGTYKKVDYQYILTTGNWELGSTELKKPMIVTSNSQAVLYVKGDFKAKEDIVIESGAKLILYMAGKKFQVDGKDVTVNDGQAAQFQYYGLPSNKEIKIKKNGDFVGVVYAPHARTLIEGSGDAVGSFVGKCVHFKHDGQLHFDEGLNTTGTEMDMYALATWKEL